MDITLLRRSLVFTLLLAMQCVAARAQDSRAVLFDKNRRFKRDMIKGGWETDRLLTRLYRQRSYEIYIGG